MTTPAVQQIPGVEWSEVGVTISEDLSYEQWEEVLRRAAVLGDAARWWIGDLLIFGEGRYGERYAQALSLTRVGHETLTRYRQVCEAIPRRIRGRNLSFSHYRLIAACEQPLRAGLIQEAEEHGWTREQLRQRIADVRQLDKLVKEPREPKQEVLGAERTVGAAAGLATVRDSLRTTYEHLRDPEKTTALRAAETIAPAVRALDEAAQTLTAAAKVVDFQNALDRAARYYRDALTEIIAVTHWDVPDYEKVRALAVSGIRAADHELKEVSNGVD